MRRYTFLRVSTRGGLFLEGYYSLRSQVGVLFGRVIVRGPAPRASQGFCGISGLSARSYVIYACLRVFAVFNFNTLHERGSFFGELFLRGSVEVLSEGIILRGAVVCALRIFARPY